MALIAGFATILQAVPMLSVFLITVYQAPLSLCFKYGAERLVIAERIYKDFLEIVDIFITNRVDFE